MFSEEGIGRCQRRYQRRKGQLEAAPEAIVAPEEQTETSNDSKHPWEDYFSFEVEYAQVGDCIFVMTLVRCENVLFKLHKSLLPIG